MKVDALLSRLDRVKQTGADQWLARCPAHQDNSPSLSIRETDDRVLVHCFAECSVESIVDAVGLTLDDLFPEKIRDHVKPWRRPYPAADVLEALANESLIVAVAAGRLGNGLPFSAIDRERLLTASARIESARKLALG